MTQTTQAEQTPAQKWAFAVFRCIDTLFDNSFNQIGLRDFLVRHNNRYHFFFRTQADPNVYSSDSLVELAEIAIRTVEKEIDLRIPAGGAFALVVVGNTPDEQFKRYFKLLDDSAVEMYTDTFSKAMVRMRTAYLKGSEL